MASRIPDLVVDSKLEVQCFKDHSIQTRLVSDPATGRRRTLQQERWQRTKELGRGTFGVVWLEECVTGPSLGKVCAVKEIVKQTASASATAYSRELEAMAKFSQEKYRDSFVRSFGWYENKNAIFITMEYLVLGDLGSGHLKKPLPSSEARQITQQLLEGLSFMHDNNFAHRDLKPANVLVLQRRPEWWVKIADFGIAKRIEGTELRTVIGTEAYLALEVRGIYSPDSQDDEGAFSLAVDVWAIGAITFRMITGQIPFPPGRKLSNYVVGGKSFLTGHIMSPECTSFLLKTMAASPNHRPTSQEALSYPWIKVQDPIPSSSASTSQSFERTEKTSTLASAHWAEPSAQWTDLSAKCTDDLNTLRIQNNGISSTACTARKKPPTLTFFQELDRGSTVKRPGHLMPAISHIHSITFSPDGRHIACSGVSIYDRGIILIFEEDQDRLRRIPAPISDFGDYVSQVAFSKDGWLASSCQKGIIIFKEKNGALKQIQELKSQSVFSIAFAPDRRWLVSGTCDGTIQIWANDRGRLKYAYKVKQGTMFGSKYREVAFSPDGRRIASIVDEGKIEIWEYNPGRLKQTQQLMNLSDEFPYSVRMAFSSNGQWLAAINVRLSIVQIWADNSQGRLELVQKLECHIAVSSIAFSANGQWLASGGHSNVVQIWAYKQGKFELAQKLERPGLLELPMNEVTSLAFSPNGQILILGFDGGIIEVWKNDSE